MRLQPLRAGIYEHYKGPLYNVLFYAHDANADGTPEGIWACTDLTVGRAAQPTYTKPLAERIVVVYHGLQLDGAHAGPRMAVRSVDDFFAYVDPRDGSRVPQAVVEASQGSVRYIEEQGYVARFTYRGASYEPGMSEPAEYEPELCRDKTCARPGIHYVGDHK